MPFRRLRGERCGSLTVRGDSLLPQGSRHLHGGASLYSNTCTPRDPGAAHAGSHSGADLRTHPGSDDPGPDDRAGYSGPDRRASRHACTDPCADPCSHCSPR